MTSTFLLKAKKQLETLIQTVRIYSQDIKSEFGIENCTILEMKNWKWHIIEEVELVNAVVIRTLIEKETYKYLGIVKADTIKRVEMKEENFKKISQKNKKITPDKTLLQEPCQRDEYLSCPSRKILRTILEVEQRRV